MSNWEQIRNERPVQSNHVYIQTITDVYAATKQFRNNIRIQLKQDAIWNPVLFDRIFRLSVLTRVNFYEITVYIGDFSYKKHGNIMDILIQNQLADLKSEALKFNSIFEQD